MSLSGNLPIPLRRIHPYLSFALLGTNPMGRRSPSFMEGLPSESTTTTSSSSIIITTMYCYCFCYVSHCITNNAVIFLMIIINETTTYFTHIPLSVLLSTHLQKCGVSFYIIIIYTASSIIVIYQCHLHVSVVIYYCQILSDVFTVKHP